MPAMLRHWEGLQRFQETRSGYEALKALSDALLASDKYIEFPFGEYKRLKPQERPKKPSEWHMAAALIAGRITELTEHQGLGSDCVVVGVVAKALERMGYKTQRGTISQHLVRHKKKCGRLPGNPASTK